MKPDKKFYALLQFHYGKSSIFHITLLSTEREREEETSNKVRSLPPVMFHTIPVALSMPISNKGDWIAFNAASLALVFPVFEKKNATLKFI